jgi:hypothetical protein
MSLFTNEFKSSVYLFYSNNVTGTLNNLIIADGCTTLSFQETALSGGTLSWNKNIVNFNALRCVFNTAAVDSQLSVINTYFASVTPIKKVTINLSGATMGIPTGGASNTDLLGIVAKHVAAGFTATITVRTS